MVVAEVPELPYTDKPCFYRPARLANGVFLRVADGDRRATVHEVQLLREARGQPQHDLEPVADAAPADLDRDRVQALLDSLRGRPDAPWREWDDLRVLHTVRALVAHEGRLVPSLAGWLCLAPYPQERFPNLAVAFIRYPTPVAGELGPQGERFLDNQLIEGPLPVMVREVIRVAKRNMQRRGIVRGLYREDLWEYPEEVLREAVVNALVHRDLSPAARGTLVQVQMYPDRLEALNPGGLFGPVVLERLGEPGQQAARNAHLVRLVTELAEDQAQRRLCENRGTGIAVMVERLREAGMAPPEFHDSLLSFRVCFPNHSLLDPDTLQWVQALVGDRASDTQRRVLAWLRHSGRDLDNATYRWLTSVDSRIATRELADLVAAGILERSGSRRWARYRLAAGGMNLRQAEIALPPAKGRRARADRSMELLDLLAREGPMSAKDLASRTGLSSSAVRHWLHRLKRAGKVRTIGAEKAPAVRYEVTGEAWLAGG